MGCSGKRGSLASEGPVQHQECLLVSLLVSPGQARGRLGGNLVAQRLTRELEAGHRAAAFALRRGWAQATTLRAGARGSAP